MKTEMLCAGQIAILGHDCDFEVYSVVALRAIEIKHNIKSTWFLRPEAWYFEQSIPMFQEWQKEGWDVGLHYDGLSRLNNMSMALTLTEQQLNMMRCFFDIKTIRHHGDNYDLTISNHWLFGNYTYHFEHDLGVVEPCTSTFPDFAGWSYIADTNLQWNEPAVLNNHVYINIHSDWWPPG